MAKHRKVNSRDDTGELVKLQDNMEPEAVFEYEDDGEDGGEKKKKVPKAVYRIAIVLLALVLGLTLWINRDNLTPENIWSWIKLQVVGSGDGDGFPVQITGSNVYESNFLSHNGNAVVLSDTALTILSPSGKQELSLRHSLNSPTLCQAGGRFLLYNSGSTGYLTLSGNDTVVNSATEKEILAGAISHNGKFALGVQGSEGASELNVYQKNPNNQGQSDLQFNYLFAKDYITAIALNYDGSFGAVCTVRSEKGEMVSKITIFDFNKQEPLGEYETWGNLLLAAYWGQNGSIYAIGDSAMLTGSYSSLTFSEYSYDGRQPTAFHTEANRAFLSISAYEHAGPSTLLIFDGDNEPLRIEEEKRIEAISVSGGTVGMLVDTTAVFCDFSTGVELGRADAGSDAKGLALASEKMAYVLGVSEVRTVEPE